MAPTRWQPPRKQRPPSIDLAGKAALNRPRWPVRFMEMTDPIALAQALIRRPSVTPQDEGALGVLEDALKPLGFACHRLRFEADGTPPVENLYARLGSKGPNFCFAGHTDVVPPGDPKRWRSDPFAAEVRDGVLYGRGATDMKGAIAAFVAAASRVTGATGE